MLNSKCYVDCETATNPNNCIFYFILNHKAYYFLRIFK